MKYYLLLSIAILTSLGCSQQESTPWRPVFNGGYDISRHNCAIYGFIYSDIPDHSVVFFFPFGIGSSAAHYTDPVSQTFNYSGTIKNEEHKENKFEVLEYEISSANPNTITCNGMKYDLTAGTVFKMDANYNLVQLPFVGTKPTMDYLDTLQQYFSDEEKQQNGPTGNTTSHGAAQ